MAQISGEHVCEELLRVGAKLMLGCKGNARCLGPGGYVRAMAALRKKMVKILARTTVEGDEPAESARIVDSIYLKVVCNG